ncbi:MAG TPA: glycosyltransferase [Vicinamibacterales bacterium]|nr:glycosyltransferase [Vicinamibacterales bacterium]
MSSLHVTVAICTWNRCIPLEQTLHGLTGITAPADATWELLIVNNNCTDQTDHVIRAFEGRLPIKRVVEARSGLSHARNRAVAEARGDYILWTDDDVTVCPNYLVEYVRAFKTWPDASIFGGPIEPCFDGTPPPWLLEIYPTIAGVYAARDFGPAPMPLSRDAIPWGANYVIRADAQARHLYDPDLGYRPGRLVGWEETEVILALLADGAHGWWVPGAALRHHVPKQRQTTKYLRTHFYNRGIYYGSRWNEIDKRLVFGRPRWLWKRVVESELKYRLHKVWSKPEVWVQHLITSSESWGLLNGYVPKSEV